MISAATGAIALVVALLARKHGVDHLIAAVLLGKPSLDDPDPALSTQTPNAENAHLAVEASRDLLTSESPTVTRHNLAWQRALPERIREPMNRYTDQQLIAAEVVAALIEPTREMATEGNRGAHFTPPLAHDELVFYDTVNNGESAVTVQGDDVLAHIVRDFVVVMRRGVRTDWAVRDDVHAKLRSELKRLLVTYEYPPDKQPEAIRFVIEAMESMAPRFAA